MLELFQHYTISDILIFIILLALAIKSFVSFLDWGFQYIKKFFDIGYSKLTQKEALQDRLQHGSQVMAMLQSNQKRNNELLKQLFSKIDLLIQSDKDSIKAYITKEHHYYCYVQGWIDDFSLDCIEKRYQHYVDYHGNSFVEGLMDELRALPKQPPQNINKDQYTDDNNI